MKKFIAIIIILIVTLPVIARKDTKKILEEVKKISEILSSVDDKITIMSSEITNLDKRLKIIEEKVSVISKKFADTNQDKENLYLSLQFLKEEINGVKNSLSKISDILLNLNSSSISSGVNSGINTENKNNQNENNTNQVVKEDPKTIYYTAYSDYLKKNYDLAIQGFEQFIQSYPEHTLADNALYWIGECYYSQKKYNNAINKFTELITKYKDADKLAAAILKKGYALIEMGNREEGIKTLKMLISKFPLSEEASLAQQKIKEVED